MQTTLGQLLINKILPPKFRDYNRILTKDTADELLTEIAKDDPSKYRDISYKLMGLGREASFLEGTTLKLSDLHTPINKTEILNHITLQEQRIAADKTMSKEDKDKALELVYAATHKLMTDQTYSTALTQNNPFALQVKSKARGNPVQLSALLTSPGVYQDAENRTIPVFIRKSYAEGLDPHEYWAATYGARKGVISTKLSTREAGALGKQLGGAVSTMIVTAPDCGTLNGIPVKADDNDNIGAVLARAALNFPAGTVINKEVLSELNKKNVDEIVVRSPMTCALPEGLCKQCVGQREDGKFPPIGYHVGLNATSALTERMAQNSLNQKHCLFEKTQVYLANGSIKEIKDIQVGDIVMGADLEGNLKPTKVLHKYNRGDQECYRTTFIANGTHKRRAKKIELISTLKHRLLAARYVSNQLDAVNNKLPRKLEIGQRSKYFFALAPNTTDTAQNDEHMALLVGLLLGDGCYTEAVDGVHFSTADLQLVKELKAYLASLNLKLTKLKGHKYYYNVSLIEDILDRDAKGRVVCGTRNPIRKYLENNNMYGKYSYEKEIPEIANTWSNKSVAELLGGLIITDGSVYIYKDKKPGISMCSTSRILLEGMQRLLLLRFGILASSITQVGHKDSHYKQYYHKHDAWAFTITQCVQVLKFAKYIPLFGAKKDKLQKYITGYVPHVRTHFPGFKRVDQQYVGVLPTYDIEIDHPDHLFLLNNGLIVSNSGGQGNSKDDIVYSGFDIINNLANIPKTFPNRATIAEIEGKITKIVPATQGGTNIYIDDNPKPLYVSPDLPVKVKVGEQVELGDALSQGVVNPAEVVKYKGIGEGRRYFAERLTQAFRDTNYAVNRRNTEVLARSLIDHVAINEQKGLGDYLPGDVISYNALAKTFRPRKSSRMLALKKAKGQYLEEPVLQYTLGTRVTNKMIKQLGNHGVESVMTNSEPVGFTPNMVSAIKVPQYEKDWMARLGSTYLQSRLLQDVQRGAKSQAHSLNPIPGIAKGTFE